MGVDVWTAPLALAPQLKGLLSPSAYLLALTAVFLLAFRERWAYRTVSFLLAVLWACMALALQEDQGLGTEERLWVGALFLVQSLLFFLEGVLRRDEDGIWGRLRFEPRASAGPVAGGLFLAYSLVVHPLLATFGVGPFRGPMFGLPFCGVLFTFGLLLFLQRPFPRSILVLPLIWAAVGGLTAFRQTDPGLFAALLAGAFLALPGRRFFVDAEGSPRLETWYEHAARHHRKCGRCLLLLLLTTCFLGFLVTATREDRGPVYLLLRQLEISSTFLSVLVLGLWLSLPAWYSSGFRMLAWEGGRALRAGRKLWDWLTVRWGGVVLLVAVLAFAVWQIQQRWKGDLPQGVARELVLAGFSLFLLYAIYRARRRIIISEFLNHTGDKEPMDSLAKGLASRLHNELASISSLYRTIDEAMPPQAGGVIGVTVGVEDRLESLSDIMGPDSSVKLGKVEIPVGLLFRGLSRLVRGPRLTGSLHRQGDGYMVLADLSGGGLSGSWRVSCADLTPEERAGTAAVYRMAEQLAYRIITSLGNFGSPRWEAVRYFTQALRSYRTTQLTKSNASPELRAAEGELIMALSMDRNFSQCHYNLGVIYQGLKVYESAESSFRQILSEDPDWAEAYYALATVYFETGHYQKSAIFARKMIEIRPGDARAWNLNGLARYMQRDEEALSRDLLEQEFHGPAFDDIARSFKIAAAVAWRSLCAAALNDSSRPLRKERHLAVRCVNNLAIIKGNEGDGAARRAILEQAFRLSPRDAKAHLICGESLFEEQQWDVAQTELYQVVGDALGPREHVLRWTYLLGAHSMQWINRWSLKDQADVLRAYASLLNHMVPLEAMILASPRSAEAAARRREYGRQLDSFENVLKLVAKQLLPGPDPFSAPLRLVHFLRGLELGEGSSIPLEGLPSDQQDWARAQARIHRARQILEKEPAEAAREAGLAVEWLEKQSLGRQVERQGLHSLIAKAWVLDADRSGGSEIKEAVYHAELSVAQEPGHAARRWILADVYSAAGDFEEACAEREAALRLGSGSEILNDIEALGRTARDYLLFAGQPERRAPEVRVRRGKVFFARILQLVESRRSNRSQPRCLVHAAAHFWIGRFHCELGECDEGINHLRLAQSLAFRPIELGLRLGNAYSGMNDRDEARRAFVGSLLVARKGRIEEKKSTQLEPTPFADQAPEEPEVEVLLSCAMLYAERGAPSGKVSRLCQRAQKRLSGIQGKRQRELRALYDECVGWTEFRNGQIEAGRRRMERAARVTGERRTYARLALIYEKAGASGGLSPEEAARKAKEARQRAGQNGSFPGRGVFDLLPGDDPAREPPVFPLS
jgi:tetratricopeptide (TPR) repeat protein